MATTWYREGAASVTKSSRTVTGTGTKWVANVRAGDGFQGPDGRLYEVINVASDTALSIEPAYIGATVTGQNYWAIPVQGYVKLLADRASRIIQGFEGSEQTAIDSAQAAAASAASALASKDSAAASAASASSSKDSAAASASSASTSASNAATSEANAKDYRDQTETLLSQAIDGISGPVVLQPQVISENVTIPTGFNALLIGDVHVSKGVIIEGQGTAVLRGL